MAGSLVLSGQSPASLSDKLTELDELQERAAKAQEQAEEKAKEADRKNERRRTKIDGENARTGEKDKRVRVSSKPSNNASLDVGSPTHNGDGNNDNVATGRNLGTFEATFYTAYCSTGCTGTTATGIDVSQTIYHEGVRIIAVDPAVIPLGTRVKVTLADGSSFVATASDTGGDIKGRRIDVLVANKAEARRLGRQKAEVEVIK